MNGECKELQQFKPECTRDDECSSDLACINNHCRSPCNCGLNANCRVIDHRPICNCLENYEGNPNIVCHTVGCRSDSECEVEKACVNSNCINPCLLDKNKCGSNSECYVRQPHTPECRCLNGYRGNPLTGCKAIECLSDNDCSDDKLCSNERCIPACLSESHKCAARANCIARDHQAQCKCNPGMIGNPYISCDPEKKFECEIDSDCQLPTHGCLSGFCKDLCLELHPCNTPAKCQVIPSSPIRTMICICPDGYISSGSGSCKQIDSKIIAGCIADSDCPPERSCVNNLCRDPCNCGPNAECRIKEHKPVNILFYFFIKFEFVCI